MGFRGPRSSPPSAPTVWMAPRQAPGESPTTPRRRERRHWACHRSPPRSTTTTPIPSSRASATSSSRGRRGRTWPTCSCSRRVERIALGNQPAGGYTPPSSRHVRLSLPDEPDAGGDPIENGAPDAADRANLKAGEQGASLAEALEAPPGDSQAEAYLQRARLAEDRLGEVLAAYRKLKADNEAHRGRVTKNLERRFEQRLEKLLVDFIDILDNFDRALEATEQTYAGNPLI